MRTLSIHILLGISIIILNFIIPDIIDAVQYYVLAITLLLIGIPHGAMDHVIDGAMNNWKVDTFNIRFYSLYLGLIALYVIFWLIFPLAAMAVFLLITTYHFGQADVQRFELKKLTYWLMLFTRGLTLLLLLLFADLAYASSIIESITAFNLAAFVGTSFSVDMLIYWWAIITSAIIFVSIYKSIKSFRIAAIATLENVVLIMMFKFANIVIAFSLYFGFWHSYEHVKVMADYLFSKGQKLSFGSFYKQSFTFSMLAYLGLLFIYNLLDAYSQTEYMIGLLLILISVLTLPHLVIVEQLFKQKKG